MGITYKAFDTNLRCHVALKVINAAYLNSERWRASGSWSAGGGGFAASNVATVFHLRERG